MGAGCCLDRGFDRQRHGDFRLRWSRADAPGSADARGGGATHTYFSANKGRYSDFYCYRATCAFRYAASNPNGNAFPKVCCYALFTYPDALADAHNNEHANAPAKADAGCHAHIHTDPAFDDL
jgi:hypothetical protein